MDMERRGLPLLLLMLRAADDNPLLPLLLPPLRAADDNILLDFQMEEVLLRLLQV